jgi:NADH:ubiquinone reductase (H+-translocating)
MAGLATARELRGRGLAVTLLDAQDYTTFAPLLFEAATAMVGVEDVVTPVRSRTSGWTDVSFRVGAVEAVSWDHRRVRLSDGDELPFDFLCWRPAS